MPSLAKKVKQALDEIRVLVLIIQVLAGFELRAFFEPRFDSLGMTARYLMLTGTGLLLGCLALLMAAAPYNQWVDRGNCTPGFHRLITLELELVFAPFAFALGLAIYTVCTPLLGAVGALAPGAGITLVALFCWIGVGLLLRPRGAAAGAVLEGNGMDQPRKPGEEREAGKAGTDLSTKVEQVLTESRVVLPGTQALLGFQLLVFMTETFEALPRVLRLLHVASLLLVALSAILLITPPAYHRIVEQGEDTARFHRFASQMLLAAMLPLAAGMTLDFYILLMKVTQSPRWSLGIALAMFSLFLGLWFVLPLSRAYALHGSGPPVHENRTKSHRN